jgi:hypothetical protein
LSYLIIFIILKKIRFLNRKGENKKTIQKVLTPKKRDVAPKKEMGNPTELPIKPFIIIIIVVGIRSFAVERFALIA